MGGCVPNFISVKKHHQTKYVEVNFCSVFERYHLRYDWQLWIWTMRSNWSQKMAFGVSSAPNSLVRQVVKEIVLEINKRSKIQQHILL